MKLSKLYLLTFILFIGCKNVKSQVQPQTIPSFSFLTLDGKPFTDKNIALGKKSIILLFDASCEHCQHEIKAIGKQYSAFKSVNLYLVSMDDKSEIVKFMNTYGKGLNGKKNVTVLNDPQRQFIPKFGPTKYPSMYIYSETGKLIEYLGGQKEVKEVLAALNKSV